MAHPGVSSSAPPLVAFDNSALSRLTDVDPRLAGEIAAVEAVVAAIRDGRLRLLASQILYLEVTRTPAYFHAPLLGILDLAVASVLLEPTRPLAHRLAAIGFRPADALHVAAAYTGGADYLLSYDRRHFLGRAARITALLGPGPLITSPEDCLQRERRR